MKMAYVRWSTTVGFDLAKAFPGKNRRDSTMAWIRLDNREQDRLLADQRAYFSSWYAYWSVGSIDQLGRKGQILRIASNRIPMDDWGQTDYTYDLLKEIATRGRWAMIPGYAVCQDQRDCFLLADAVRDWLADVEASFSDG